MFFCTVPWTLTVSCNVITVAVTVTCTAWRIFFCTVPWTLTMSCNVTTVAVTVTCTVAWAVAVTVSTFHSKARRCE
jgi:hypothetical protein